MLRRLFLVSSIAAAMCIPSIGKAADNLKFEHSTKDVVTVNGKPEKVIAFMYRYQDALWTEWRSNEYLRKQYRTLEKSIREGGDLASQGFFVGCDITRKAFVSAIR